MSEPTQRFARLLEGRRALGVLSLSLLGVVLAVGVRVLVAAGGDGYQVLIADAPEPSEVLRLASLFCREDIPHRIEDGGRTLYVSDLHREQAVALVMEEGLQPEEDASPGPGDFFGFSSGYATDPTQAQERGRKSRELELARTIQLYPSVQLARVHLDMPQPRPLGAARRRPPSASVFLRLKPFRRLSPAQAWAIRQLVANAVGGLAAEKVMVADSRGTDYSRPPSPSPGTGAGGAPPRAAPLPSAEVSTSDVGDHLGWMRGAEKAAEQRVLSHLERLFGGENVTVSVCASMAATASAGPITATAVKVASVAVTVNTRIFDGGRMPPRVVETVRDSSLAALGLGPDFAERVQVHGAPFLPRTEPAPPKTPAAPPPLSRAAASPLREAAALPLGILLLFAGSVGVLKTTRSAPCPGLRDTDAGDLDLCAMREDPATRREQVLHWSLEDPDFAARVATRLLGTEGDA